jgi:VCBS repeat-containing protein
VDGDQLVIQSVQDASNGTVVLEGSKILFTPNPGYTGPASFLYIVSDGNGGTSAAGVVINVVAAPPPENEAPMSMADSYRMAEDGVIEPGAAVGLLANDTDPNGDTLIAILHEGPKNGTLTLNEDGSFKYVPKANFHGTDSFTYVANDGTENGQLTTVTILVDPQPDLPVAVADAFILAEDGTLNVSAAQGVLANDTDVEGRQPDGAAGPGPANGTLTLNPDGSFSYVPNANFAGQDSFTYQAAEAWAQARSRRSR